MKSRCGRADLLWARVAPGLDATIVADFLGFEKKERPVPESIPFLPEKPTIGEPFIESLPRETIPSEPVLPEPSTQGRFWVVEEAHFGELPADRKGASNVRVPWREQSKTIQLPSSPDLVSWPRLWRCLRPLLCQPKAGRAIDYERLVDKLSRLETVRKFPVQQHKSLFCQLKIVLDRSRRLLPFADDQKKVVRHLERWFPKQGIKVGFCNDASSPVDIVFHRLSEYTWDSRTRRTGSRPANGDIVLAFSDLGFYGNPDVQEDWKLWGKQLHGQNVVRRAMVPVPKGRWDNSVADLWEARPWNPQEGIGEVDPQKREERAYRLLSLVSNAVWLEPGLLRRVRRLLPPKEMDCGTEVDACQHSAMVGIGYSSLRLDPEALPKLRKAARQEDPALLRKIVEILQNSHAGLPEGIIFEELLHTLVSAPVLSPILSKNEIELISDYWKNITEAMDQEAQADRLEESVDLWHRGGIGKRIDASLWSRPDLADLAKAFRRSQSVAQRFSKDAVLPPGMEPDDFYLPKEVLVQRWQVWQQGPELVFTKKLGFDQAKPANASLMVEFLACSPTITLETQQRAQKIPLTSGLRLVFPPSSSDGPVNFVLVTDLERLHFAPISRLDWAEMGRDEYGLYAVFEHKKVRQKMRWINAGRFMMGSPKNESERLSNEEQHEVWLTKGYWIADTACTQELWEAVMAENPSEFKGERRPVENVSWDDCQKFFDRMKAWELTLPTEAQWEYACRAGTTTAFSFGDNVTTDQVNYYGSHPYANGATGEYRKKTVEVGSLPSNQWGLYEMHGNVWEWCEDFYEEYKRGRAIDPCNLEVGPRRVLRGGSWDSFGGYCRSADRDVCGPGVRLSYFGFRFSRGQNSCAKQEQAGKERVDRTDEVAA